MAGERDPRDVWLGCERFAVGYAPPERDPRATLLALAERAPSEVDVDRYGGGALAQRLEQRVAALVGQEAAVWLPSGTMAQQIALRIHADRRGTRHVAFHPWCHLDVHEERGYEVLHGLRATLLGSRERLITADDVAAVAEPLAALLLELPQRDLGGALPPWDELVACVEAGRAQGPAVHLDGARLWQCGPFYARGLEEVGALFDSVYVSFYKDLRAPAGCALAGPEGFVAEARTWLVRHGGRLFTAYPYLLAAERGLDDVLPLMPQLVAHMHELGGALAGVAGLQVAPSPPQAAMLHLFARGDADELKERSLDLAERRGTWIGAGWSATSAPGVSRLELSVSESSLAVPPAETAGLYSELLGSVPVG